MADFQQRPGDNVLAGMLADARRLLTELELSAGERDRLHRQFIAVCDAIKGRQADHAAGLRRLAAFLSTLDKAAAKCHGDKHQKDRSTP